VVKQDCEDQRKWQNHDNIDNINHDFNDNDYVNDDNINHGFDDNNYVNDVDYKNNVYYENDANNYYDYYN